MNKNFMTLREYTKEEIEGLINKAYLYKQNNKDDKYDNIFNKKRLLMIFEKTSTRTRISFESGFSLLGGHPIYLNQKTSNIGLSDLKDEIRYITRNVDMIMARMLDNNDLKTIMNYTDVPVINGCCNLYHPCQALADILTIFEMSDRELENITLTYIGKLNNVSRELVYAAMRLGFRLYFVSTDKLSKENLLLDTEEIPDNIINSNNPENLNTAIKDSDFVYTDTWIDMEYFNNPEYKDKNQETMDEMLPYQINSKILSYNQDIKVMHDMPMHIGYEITRDVVESSNAIMFQQAENRLWAQNVLMMELFEKFNKD